MGVKKGYIKDNDTGTVMSFLFNPETHQEGRTVNYSEMSVPGGNYPYLQYTGGNSTEFSVSLYLWDYGYERTKKQRSSIKKEIRGLKKLNKSSSLNKKIASLEKKLTEVGVNQFDLWDKFICKNFLPPTKIKKGRFVPHTLTYCYGKIIHKCVLTSYDKVIQEMTGDGEVIESTLTLTLKIVG